MVYLMIGQGSSANLSGPEELDSLLSGGRLSSLCESVDSLNGTWSEVSRVGAWT